MQITNTVTFDKNTHRRCILLFLLLATLTACINQPSSAIKPEDGFLIGQSTITFFASTPFGTPSDAEIYLDIIDEVTGINFNPVRHKMNFVSENLYAVELSFPESSLIKYRYALGSNPTTIEYNTGGKSVQYRVLDRQSEPLIARDVIASWVDSPVNISLGRIEGKLLDANTGQGIPNLLVNLNGMQTISKDTGDFRLDSALPGKYLLTIHSMDGRYQPFQQEAIIAPEASTPVEVFLLPRLDTRVTFIVTPPPEHNPTTPIRMIGNTTHFGNTYVESLGANCIKATDAPILLPQSDGTYHLTLDLPAGMDLEYKFSIGDGFWNAERQADGQFLTRKLTIPGENSVIIESIANWRAGDRTPVRIEAHSQPGDSIPQKLYIQFYSYTWAEPIPMWQDAENSIWLYEVFSPLYLLPVVGYRMCYDAQCNDLIFINDAGEPEAYYFSTDGSQPLIQHLLPPTQKSTSEIDKPSSTPLAFRDTSFITDSNATISEKTFHRNSS